MSEIFYYPSAPRTQSQSLAQSPIQAGPTLFRSPEARLYADAPAIESRIFEAFLTPRLENIPRARARRIARYRYARLKVSSDLSLPTGDFSDRDSKYENRMP